MSRAQKKVIQEDTKNKEDTTKEAVLPHRGRSRKQKFDEEMINKSLIILGFSSWKDLEKGNIFSTNYNKYEVHLFKE